MNTRQLLAKLARILDEEGHAQVEKYKSLKKVLKSLRLEQEALEIQLAQARDMAVREDIESRLKIIVAQRKKGRIVLKQLKKARKAGA